jgi:hypothetical protein
MKIFIEGSPKVKEGSRKKNEGSPKKNVRKPSAKFGNVEKSGVMKERYCIFKNGVIIPP